VSPALGVTLCALPWVLVPLSVLWQLRGTRFLDEYPATAPDHAPLVSIVIPARDEARNVEPCLRSILTSTWPAFEVIVVDDHSADGTGEIARRIAAGDARVRVLDAPPLPDGWFGKQWACHNGSMASRGAFLLFTDADTRHGPALLTLAMNAARERRADLLSVGGAQTMGTFWERLVQPHVFSLLIARYGNSERMSGSTNPLDKIANGQFLLVTRAVYDACGGHSAVRSHVAEDLRMAQEWTRLGYSVQLLAGDAHLATRMYHGLTELMRGWGKNIYAAGKDTLALRGPARAVLRALYPVPALWELVPPVVALAALAGFTSPAVGAWGAVAYTASTLFWVVLHAVMGAPRRYAPLHPLAAAVVFVIMARAAWHGDQVEWKGRIQRSA
jgi:chlorobactene glucosyltransferase